MEFDKDYYLPLLMGPNCVLQIEELTQRLSLTPEMRILDLGCGNGLTSIYLARKFGSQVFAADLWIDPSDNFERFKLFGLENRIVPLKAEAHDLPFAFGYFDAVVSAGAYNYFGTDPDYLDTHISPLLKKDGIVAISMPGLKEGFTDGVPEELKPFWHDDFHFHSPDWWKRHWEHSPFMEVQDVFPLRCHTDAWKDWLQTENPYAVGDRPMMEAENGKYYATVGIVGKLTEECDRSSRTCFPGQDSKQTKIETVVKK